MPYHVVLVDPSPSRETLAERLRMQGYVVTTAADAASGAHVALSDPPAVVVADLWMPGISGIQLCRLLRSEPATESVPVVLRGPDQNLRDRFWAERAGAVAYVGSGRMGDLVRTIARAIAASPPQENPFFTQLSGGELDLRDRIAAHLDAALFDSVIASEVRALGVCGSFTRLFDLLTQFVTQVTSYRWLAVQGLRPMSFALHTHPAHRALAEAEARAAFGLGDDVPIVTVEDEDAVDATNGPPVRVADILLGAERVGRIALASRHPSTPHDSDLLRIVARELGGPLRIAALMEESDRLAMMDPLTSLMNRRAFSGAARRELHRLERNGEPLCVLLLDIDNFKVINDKRGHHTGDRVLTALGRLLPGLVRRADVVGRWGGEEFVLLLPGCAAGPGQQQAEDIRAAIAGMVVHDDDNVPMTVTASLGLTTFRPGDTVESLIDRADHAMYAAKTAGRNRVVADVE